MASPGEPLRGDQARARRSESALARRLVSIPRTVLLFAFVTTALPLLLVVALCVDAARAVLFKAPWVGVRLVAFLQCYLFAEVTGLAALFFVWIASGFGASHRRLVDGTYVVQSAWVGFLFESMRRLFGLRFEVEGDGCVTPGPILVFMSHASLADTLLPSVFITRRHGLRLRFVLKRELLQDPCLDVAGNRIANHFVARGSKEGAAEIEAVRELTRDLGPAEGVLIYPEGTRFTEGKRRALIERLGPEGGRALALAERLRHVLPPRYGGPLALLDGHTQADVVMLAHRGLEGFATVADVWRGGLVGRTVQARMWRVPRSAIPLARDQRAAWLDEQWAAVDDFVGAGESTGGEPEDGGPGVER
jgi:1-acyl-sn-glycerol-3-phosphate acyltransferase